MRRDEVFEPCKIMSRGLNNNDIHHLQRSCRLLGEEAHILCESRHWSSRFVISEIRGTVIKALVQARDGMHRTVGDQLVHFNLVSTQHIDNNIQKQDSS